MVARPNPDPIGIRVKERAALPATQALATATDSVLMLGYVSLWISVEVNVLSTVTQLGVAFEARDSPTAAWAPLDVQDLVPATGIATLTQYIAHRDVTALVADGRRMFRAPAWAREIRAFVWAEVGAPGISEATIYAARGV